MIKLLALTTLALASASLACPVKAGYVANGLFKDTSKTTPICGPLYLAFKNSMAGSKWTEMYALASDKIGQTQAGRILGGIQKSGYKQVRAQKTPRNEVYQFQRGGHVITAVLGISGPTRYLALAGQ
ncbi:hypothetical protein E5F05_16490 [Deinococcus metallilatus]|uniref:Uncharacterized protein n=1 Tax=Deinococcus metallilatus TaxID=1211322 RepID=A0AAJ5F595_9DEIO|nr:hypothetical protein [Deinococcus metallilatus]MBB5294892.1 hypothetical protein [Deinococcus metallilatus]QBY09395.1 hypothetical protein E5F05_16490 [Deinococcus metallilatus]RXJ09401.1 hypothetical protein ERJ73_15330 [Deinococcus metallilatus]TLK28923.1 hypothetical protein FCS05_07095 [Deinococcus metallilatus]GMA16821.1 hypothetical protein GCM10025871_31520 [Deinococcus metallilatus]